MHTFKAMNTIMVTDGLPGPHQTGCEEWFEYAEQTLSRFLPDSELSRLNRSAPLPFKASRLLFELLSVADGYYRETAGLFNPYLGSLLSSLGYATSFERREHGTFGTPVAGRYVPNAERCRLNKDTHTVTLGIGASVDLGGIAKGWAAHSFALSLQKEGVQHGAIGAGGDLALWGPPSLARDIDIACPLREGRDLLTLTVHGTMGIATSSSEKRRWLDPNGQKRHHILDPRSGSPSDSDLVQVTLIAPNVLQAEIYAKCMLILGERAGARWLGERHPNCAAIVVRHDGSWGEYGAFGHYLRKGAEACERIG